MQKDLTEVKIFEKVIRGLIFFSKHPVYLRDRLRLITARQLSAYMSSRALATTTASSWMLNWLNNVFNQSSSLSKAGQE